MRIKAQRGSQPKIKSRYFMLVLLGLTGVVTAMTIYVALSKPPEPNITDADKPTLAEEVLALARPLMDKGQYGPAASLMASYVSSHAGDVEVRCVLAEALMKLQRYEQAEHTVDDVIRRVPRMARAHWLKGELVLYRGGENAMYFFRQAAECPDAGPEIWAAYGRELLAGGRFELAGQYLRRAREGGVNDARTLAPLGELALRDKQFEQAESLLAEAVKSAPASARIWAMLAMAQKNSGKIELALKTLQDGLSACGQQVALYMELGDVLWLLHRRQAAAEAFAKAAEHGPLQAQAAQRAARCYYLIGQYERALTYVNRAAALYPGDPEVEFLKGRIADARLNQTARSAPAASDQAQSGP